MAKKSCTYCDSTSHQTGSCPHLPHGDAHRVEKPARKKAVVCGIGITYNPNSPKNRMHKVQGAIVLRLEQYINDMRKRFLVLEDTEGTNSAEAAKRLIEVTKENT